MKATLPHWIRLRHLVVVTATVVLAACSSGTASGTGESSRQSAADKAGLAAAQQLVTASQGTAAFIPPGPAVNVAPLRGKTLWIISADLSIPFHQNIVKGFQEAAAAAGLRAQSFDGKGQTPEMARGIEQAVSAGASGIALISIDTRYVKEAVNRANAAHIPVVGVLNTDARATPDPGTSGEATIDYTGSGELLVAYAVTSQHGPVKALYADVSEFRVMGFLKQGIENGFRKFCPDACSLKTFDTQIADFKNQSQTKTQAELRRNPGTNWVFSAFDAQALFVVPAVKTVGRGSDVRVGSINAVSANLKFVQNDDVQVVDVGNSNSWLGWAAADRVMRAALGSAPAISRVPIKLFDKANLAGKDPNDEAALFSGTDYRSAYKALWQVQ